MSQKRSITFIFGLLLLSITTFAQPYQLHIQPIETDSFLYRITETTDFYIKSKEGNEQNREQKIVDYQFITPQKGNAIDIAIKEILIEKNGTTQNFVYDSKDHETPTTNFTKGYENLLNYEFGILLDEVGRMTMIDDFDAVFEADFSSADIFDETDFAVIKNHVKEQFSNNSFEQTMRYFQYVYQEDSIHIGESWEIIDTLYPNFGVLSTMVYTLKEVKSGIAYIKIEADLANDPNFKGIDMDMMHLKFNLSGQQEGLVLLDMETGWIRKMSIAQKLTGQMTVFFIDPQGINLKVQLKGSTDYDKINY